MKNNEMNTLTRKNTQTHREREEVAEERNKMLQTTHEALMKIKEKFNTLLLLLLV